MNGNDNTMNKYWENMIGSSGSKLNQTKEIRTAKSFIYFG